LHQEFAASEEQEKERAAQAQEHGKVLHDLSEAASFRTELTMKHYGWGIIDKDGKPTGRFLSAGNESLLVYAIGLLERERPNDAPFQVLKLLYNDPSN
jgi:hypothetical protein